MDRLAALGTIASPPACLGAAEPDRPFSGTEPSLTSSLPEAAFSAGGVCVPPQPASRPTARNADSEEGRARLRFFTVIIVVSPGPYCFWGAATSGLSSEITGVGDMALET